MFLFVVVGNRRKWRPPLHIKWRRDKILLDSHYLQPKQLENTFLLKGFLYSSIHLNILTLQMRFNTKLVLENISGIHICEHLPNFIEYNWIFVGSLVILVQL